MDEVQIHFVIGYFKTAKVLLRFTYEVGENRSVLHIFARNPKNYKLEFVHVRLNENEYNSFKQFIQTKGKDFDLGWSQRHDFSFSRPVSDSQGFGTISFRQNTKTGVKFDLDASTHEKIHSYIQEIEIIRARLKELEGSKSLAALVHSILPPLPKWESPDPIY